MVVLGMRLSVSVLYLYYQEVDSRHSQYKAMSRNGVEIQRFRKSINRYVEHNSSTGCEVMILTKLSSV